jgi:hypothetical protein
MLEQIQTLSWLNFGQVYSSSWTPHGQTIADTSNRWSLDSSYVKYSGISGQSGWTVFELVGDILNIQKGYQTNDFLEFHFLNNRLFR